MLDTETIDQSIPTTSAKKTSSQPSESQLFCIVCDSTGAEHHFGGICCRACAAFFRRYFKSKKNLKICSCQGKTTRSHPCRSCRIERCFEAGMTPDKLQNDRDKTAKKLLMLQVSFSGLQKPSTRITSKDTSHLCSALINYEEFETARIHLTAGRLHEMNVFELSSKTKVDIDLTWRMAVDLFSSLDKLRISDKEALLRNFYLKFWIISPILDSIKYEKMRIRMKREDRNKLICLFYEGSFTRGNDMSKKEILKLFGPYWWWFCEEFVPPILEFRLDKEELMGIVWILFFDHAYSNLTDDCVETSRNIKKVILRSLRNYQLDREFDETRLIGIMEIIEKIEKLEDKFVEQMLFYQMHNVRMHDDFRRILMENKY